MSKYESLGHESGVYARFQKQRYFAGTVVDGVKQPRAPWLDDDAIPADKDYDSVGWDTPVGHNWPGVETTMTEALNWIERIPRDWFLATRIGEPEDRSVERLVLVDFDNCRHPVTGEVHPEVVEFVRSVDSYAQVSYSGTGVHVYVRSDVPEGYKIAPEGHLSDWEYTEVAGGPPEVEVYPRKRFIALTGEHLTCTPVEVRSDPDAVHALYEEYGEESTFADPEAGPGADAAGDDAHNPELSREELAEVETTSDPTVIFDAVSHVDYGDVRLRSEQTQGGNSPHERKSFDPSWEQSESGTRLGHDDGQWVYRKGDVGLDTLQVVALEERIISSVHEYPEGQDYLDAVDALRRRGANIPEFDPSAGDDGDASGPIVDRVLLPDVEARGRYVGWNYENAGESTMTQGDVYERTTRTIKRAMDDGGETLVNGLMGCGKTYSSFKAAFEEDERLMYAAPRAELYEQAVEYATDVGFDRDDILVMPSLFRDCPSATGEFGEGIADRILKLRSLGVQPKTIHSMLDLPCQEDGDCPYRAAMQFDPDQYEVLIGHYTHAHLPQIAAGRHVVIDEEPTDAYVDTLSGDQLITTINVFLSFADSPPFDDFMDLVQNRHDEDRRKAALEWFERYEAEEGWDPDELNAIRNELQGYHALTPHAVYGILDGDPVADGSPWHRTQTDGRNPVVFREADQTAGYRVTVNRPPNSAMAYAKSVIGLDGTPMLLDQDNDKTRRYGRAPLWNLALNKRFDLKRVLTDEERTEWIQDAQNIHLVQTTDAVKPYSSGEYANRQQDFALCEGASRQYGFDPVVISTKKVRDRYEARQDELGCNVQAWDHYGNVRGKNHYGNRRLGVLLGSPHYGDEWMAERAALLGDSLDPSGKGEDRDYGSDLGNSLLEAMREATVAQAALRFGRDGRGAVILIHTSAYPDWLPTTDDGAVVSTWTDTQRDALDLIAEGWTGTAQDLADHIGVTARQALNVLSGFEDRGLVSRRKDPEDGRRYEWSSDDVDGVPTYGETTLPSAVVAADDEKGKLSVKDSIREVSYKRADAGPMGAVDVVRGEGGPPGGGGGDPEVVAGD